MLFGWCQLSSWLDPHCSKEFANKVYGKVRDTARPISFESGLHPSVGRILAVYVDILPRLVLFDEIGHKLNDIINPACADEITNGTSRTRPPSAHEMKGSMPGWSDQVACFCSKFYDLLLRWVPLRYSNVCEGVASSLVDDATCAGNEEEAADRPKDGNRRPMATPRVLRKAGPMMRRGIWGIDM